MEGVRIAQAILASSTLLVTVDDFGILTAWRIAIKGYGSKSGDVAIQREATLRGHTRAVTCLGASEAWSFLVSGAEVSRKSTEMYVRLITKKGRNGNGVGYESPEIYPNPSNWSDRPNYLLRDQRCGREFSLPCQVSLKILTSVAGSHRASV